MNSIQNINQSVMTFVNENKDTLKGTTAAVAAVAITALAISFSSTILLLPLAQKATVLALAGISSASLFALSFSCFHTEAQSAETNLTPGTTIIHSEDGRISSPYRIAQSAETNPAPGTRIIHSEDGRISSPYRIAQDQMPKPTLDTRQ